MRFAHRPTVLKRLPFGQPGIYTLTGGRQVGKTTALKQWMSDLLSRGVAPRDVVYLGGELIDDHHALVALLQAVLEQPAETGIRYLLLDEATYVRDWDRGIKHLADAGLLREAVLVVTGSDSVLIRESRMRLPGRRGAGDVLDFHLYPLSFHDYASLTRHIGSTEGPSLEALMEPDVVPGPSQVQALRAAFDGYLLTGGYLSALNDYHSTGSIRRGIHATYSDWIRGDVAKRGKQERFLREVLSACLTRLGSQITWNNLAAELSIDHPATVADYVELLTRMDVLVVIPALREDRLAAAPKTARKVVAADPFILHALRSWLDPAPEPFAGLAQVMTADPVWAGRLAEMCVQTHHGRLHPTFYIKAEGEVDVAYVERARFWPVEVKWTSQGRPKDLKQVLKYRNPRMVSSLVQQVVSGVPNEYLPLHLLRLGPTPTVSLSG